MTSSSTSTATANGGGSSGSPPLGIAHLEFARRLRRAFDAGIDFPDALDRAAAALPRSARPTTERVARRMRRGGGVVASPCVAMRLLERENLVMVFPEGAKGAGQPFAERYRLQRFGRGGFVEIALRTSAAIVPVAVVGSEEIYPKLGESRLL